MSIAKVYATDQKSSLDDEVQIEMVNSLQTIAFHTAALSARGADPTEGVGLEAKSSFSVAGARERALTMASRRRRWRRTEEK